MKSINKAQSRFIHVLLQNFPSSSIRLPWQNEEVHACVMEKCPQYNRNVPYLVKPEPPGVRVRFLSNIDVPAGGVGYPPQHENRQPRRAQRRPEPAGQEDPEPAERHVERHREPPRYPLDAEDGRQGHPEEGQSPRHAEERPADGRVVEHDKAEGRERPRDEGVDGRVVEQP